TSAPRSARAADHASRERMVTWRRRLRSTFPSSPRPSMRVTWRTASIMPRCARLSQSASIVPAPAISRTLLWTSGLAERGLRRREPRHGHAVRRAAHVVEPHLLEEEDRRRIAAVLAADPELDVGPRLTPLLDRHLDELADAGDVDRRERVLR